MRNMRKAAAVLLATGMVFALTACGGNKKVENTVNSIDDLEGKSIGVQLGTTGDIYASIDNVIAKLEKQIHRHKTRLEKSLRYDDASPEYDDYDDEPVADAVQALKQGKIDCVIIDSQPAEAFVEKNDDLQILDEPFADEEYAICISKDKPELTKEFNKALAELKKDGTLDSIADNYIGDDTKGKTPYESPKDIEYPNGKLVMATNATFEPYEYYDGDNIVGIDADIAKAICDKLGYELQIEDMEFDSIIAAVQSGKADFGAAGMTVTEDRLKNIDFTDSYAKAKQVIITRK